MPNYVLKGKQVGLSPPSKEYMDHYLRWINDLRVNRYLGFFGTVFTREEEEDWYEEATGRDDQQIFTIHHLKAQQPIGNCGLSDLDHRNRSASAGIFIGEAQARNKGLGTEALTLLLDYGFSALSLQSVNLELIEYNDRAKRVYEKVGFREVGHLRRGELVDGEFYDRILMDILREEFYAKNSSLIRDNFLSEIEEDGETSPKA